MKILCVGRNYADHAKELNNPAPSEPVIFIKPDNALLRNNNDFYYPPFSKNIHYEVEVVIKINQLGKCISEKFANKYYDQIAIGIDFTARDLQDKFKSKGLPWELAKGFDGSAATSHFIPKNNFDNINCINFSLKLNNELVQQGNTSDMLFPVDKIIAFVSVFFTLKQGDLIFTGTPKGVGPIKNGDKLEAFIENTKLLECNVK